MMKPRSLRGFIILWLQDLSVHLSVLFPNAPLQLQPSAKVHRQARVTNWRNVLVAQQVLRLSVDAQPREQTVAPSQIKLRVTWIQIPVRQQQTVTAGQVITFKKIRVV